MALGAHTADDRQTSVLFRMSHEEKAKLRAEADDLGITVQALMERRLLGKHQAQTRRGGRQPKPRGETLPLTG